MKLATLRASLMMLSPSPRELYMRLSDDEKVAIDLLLQDEATSHDYLARIVDLRRIDHLRGLAAQLRVFGDLIGESKLLDDEVAKWEEQRCRDAELRAATRAIDQAFLQGLPPETRRAVERRRRRQARRLGAVTLPMAKAAVLSVR